MKSIFEIPVHPWACLIPMHSDIEIQRLADDIKANGLLLPIWTAKHNKKTVLIDGRHRLAACKLAGIEPTVEHKTGSINTLINSINYLRNDTKESQKAMAFAEMNPVTYERYSQDTFDTPSKQLLSKSRTVIQYAPDEVIKVLAGSSLNDAYTIATANKLSQETEAEAEAKQHKLLQEIQNKEPKIYQKFLDEHITIEEAITLYNQAKENHKVRIEEDANSMDGLLTALLVMGSVSGLERIIKHTREEIPKGKIMLGRDKDLFESIFNDFSKKAKILEEFITGEFSHEL